MIRLLELRTEKELSQRQIAKIMNVSQGTYNNWENSNTQPSIEQLIALADFFDVTIDYLVGNSDSYSESKINLLTEKQRTMLKLAGKLDDGAQDAIITLLSRLK